jgi:hypothetical protein
VSVPKTEVRRVGQTQSFSSLLQSVQASGEDFEWYPTTDRMIDAVSRWLDKTADSIMDIGAGDGRVLAKLATCFKSPPALYAIEKSTVLVQAQPETVIPVGTDLFEQNLACLPVHYIFCNPPYSEFETWACMVIESGHARKAFLVLPQRWKENEMIALSLKKRGATARVLHTNNFHDAPRKARAVIDIIEVSFPLKDDRYWSKEVKDPFDIWFDEHISTFDQEEDQGHSHELEQQAMARIRHLNTIEDLVEAYREEYERMEGNYRAIFQLDYALLKELGVNKETVRDGIKLKMAGLKSKYWLVLFERLEAITNRLSTATKAKFTERLTGRVTLAFTTNNAYAVVLWAIKSANKYFDEQTVTLYRELSTFENVMRYKSNIRTWGKDLWRYSRHDPEDQKPSHYALDYRIVVIRWRAIGYGSWDYPGNLSRSCHELIADIVAVLYNLGFPSRGPRSLDREWHGGEWQNWYRVGEHSKEILFQAKAYKNGNVHLRFLPDAMKALNVEAGRLLGWLRSPADVVKELGYSEEEAERFYSCTKLITPGNARLMLSAGGAS